MNYKFKAEIFLKFHQFHQYIRRRKIYYRKLFLDPWIINNFNRQTIQIVIEDIINNFFRKWYNVALLNILIKSIQTTLLVHTIRCISNEVVYFPIIKKKIRRIVRQRSLMKIPNNKVQDWNPAALPNRLRSWMICTTNIPRIEKWSLF